MYLILQQVVIIDALDQLFSPFSHSVLCKGAEVHGFCGFVPLVEFVV